MEMEKEEQRVVEEQEQEDDETTLLLRKSRTASDGNYNTITDETRTNGVDVGASIGVISVNSGHAAIVSNLMTGANGAAAKHEDSSHLGIDDDKTEELVDENGSEESKNREKKSENLVFYERNEGLWKCRICTWTYGNGSVDHFRNHHRNGQVHYNKQMMMMMMMNNFKTLKFESGEKQVREDPVPAEPDSSSGKNSTEKEYDNRHLENGSSSSNVFIIHQNNFSSTENKYEIHVENGSSSTPPPSKSLFQEANTSNGSSSKEIESAGEEEEVVELINEEEEEEEVEEVDLDVENVLKKQTTHDLYCPNCNSCITRRVILRKRKRRTSRTTSDEEELKRNKLEDQAAAAVQQVAGFVEETPTREDEEPADVFRCLACFSFFIPCAGGFKLFRKFGGKSGKENVQGGEVQQESSAKKNNWFTFMFASNKLDDKTPQVVQDVGMAQDEAHTTSKQSKEESSSKKANKQVQVNQESYKRTQLTNKDLSQLGGGSKLLISSHKGDYYSEQDGASSEDIQQQQQLLPTSVPAAAHDMEGLGTMSISVSAIPPHDDDDDEAKQVGAYVTHSVFQNKTPSFTTSDTAGGQVYPHELSQHTITNAKYQLHTGETLNFVDNISSVTGVSVTQGKDTVITIDTEQHAGSSQINLQDIITTPTASATALVSSGTQLVIRGRETSGERKRIEVIKSIVYGGLAESITSLSVVSSAAGGGAATLNILALGMANLIGGLFIICHNLWELQSDRVLEQVSNQITDEVTNKRDRYKELLGRRENFILHAAVAIISYFIFGLVPPLVYGFSFRKSDDKEFKLLGVAAASFVCVVILALGKAYVQRPPKPYIKSVSTYVILGFMVSGVSYAAGVLVERLLQELALFKFDPTTTTSGSSSTLSESAAAWSSY